MATTGSRTLKLSILADVENLVKGLKTGSQDVESFGSKVADFSKKAALAFAAAAAAAGAMAVKIGIEGVKAASDLSETISKVGVLFGDSANEINKFAATAATKLGQTKQQALDAASTFATFGKAAGLTGQDLVKFSTGFTSLASDLASFNNTSPEQAIQAIGSALRGEAEPLRAYGVLLDDASLRQAALELGIVSTTKNALTPQQKVLAAQKLIYEQTGAAQGDFERTSDGLANRTRILTAELENAKTTIGAALLPIVLEVAKFFSEKVIPIVNQVSEAFSNKVGGLGGTLNELVSTVQSYVMPIFDGAVSLFKNVRDAVTENIDEFKSFFEVVKYVAPLIGNILGTSLKVVGEIASVVLNVVAGVLSAIKPMLNTAIDGINLVIRGLNLINPFSDIPYLPRIGASVGSVSTGALGNFSMSTGSVMGSYGGTGGLAGLGGGGGATGGGTSTGGGSVGGSVNSANVAAGNVDPMKLLNDLTALNNKASALTAKVAAGTISDSAALKQLDAIIKQRDILSGQAESALGASGAFYGATSARAGEAASMPYVYNITVNGAIDSEGTARTVVNTINDSFYRGTGGATSLAGLKL